MSPVLPAEPTHSAGGGQLLALARRLVGHVLEEDGDVFARWRARLIASALLAAVTLGIVPFAITMRVLIVEGRGWLVVLHVLANAELWWLLLSRWPSNRLRSILLVTACFTVGFLSILTMGFASAALVWLFASILLSSLLLGVACTLATAGSAVLLLLGAGLAIETGHAPWIVGQPAIATRWLMVTLNFTFVSLVCALGNAIVLQVLAQEEQRRQTLERRLAEARQHESLGTLASGIAHDFNNLLVPIVHGLEELRGRPELDPPARVLIDDAVGSAAVARDLVQRILGFARQSAKERLVLAVAPVVRAVSGRITARHGVRPVITLADDASVTASTAELHQIIDNLLDNAARAASEGGDVRVEVTREVRPDGAWVRLLVRDTGPGMSPDTVARIFEPYFSTR
ncbi:MAG TPA: ATP-binding protein, partial [Gemmatimonadaceae bacterium]|nr:ATP-binding protein [Gemmatimonadaceae bacterium]